MNTNGRKISHPGGKEESQPDSSQRCRERKRPNTVVMSIESDKNLCMKPGRDKSVAFATLEVKRARRDIGNTLLGKLRMDEVLLLSFCLVMGTREGIRKDKDDL